MDVAAGSGAGTVALTYGALVLIIWARYFAVAGLFHWLLWGRPAHRVRARRLSPDRPARAIVLHEIRMSLAASAIYAVPGAAMIEAYKAGGTAIYDTVGGPLGWLWLPASALLYLFLHDTYFYWSHRLMHHRRLFRAMHLAHHRSRQPTPWAGFSFHPWEAIASAWLVPLATFFIPIHVGVLFFLLILMTVVSVTNHAGWEILPRAATDGWWGRWMISACHHSVHHTDYAANFGLYFRVWDRLMRTDRGLAPALPPAVRAG